MCQKKTSSHLREFYFLWSMHIGSMKTIQWKKIRRWSHSLWRSSLLYVSYADSHFLPTVPQIIFHDILLYANLLFVWMQLYHFAYSCGMSFNSISLWIFTVLEKPYQAEDKYNLFRRQTYYLSWPPLLAVELQFTVRGTHMQKQACVCMHTWTDT